LKAYCYKNKKIIFLKVYCVIQIRN